MKVRAGRGVGSGVAGKGCATGAGLTALTGGLVGGLPTGAGAGCGMATGAGVETGGFVAVTGASVAVATGGESTSTSPSDPSSKSITSWGDGASVGLIVSLAPVMLKSVMLRVTLVILVILRSIYHRSSDGSMVSVPFIVLGSKVYNTNSAISSSVSSTTSCALRRNQLASVCCTA